MFVICLKGTNISLLIINNFRFFNKFGFLIRFLKAVDFAKTQISSILQLDIS
jgi:hypothetical protein